MSATLESLIEALRCLPGVGPKSAQRMAYHLLQHDREGAARLAFAVDSAIKRIQHCERCNTYTETPVCERCQSDRRDPSVLCVVESPVDLNMIEQTQAYNGLYFVLMGRISPLDGLGPRNLRLDQLVTRASDGIVREVILATNFTNEGEATAHTVASLLTARGLKVSRLSRGVPVGGELEHTDTGTIAQALVERRSV